jgi:hypothetical protein
MNLRRERLVIGLAVTAIFLSCKQHSEPSLFLHPEMTELQRRTIPPDSEVVARSGPTQEGLE